MYIILNREGEEMVDACSSTRLRGRSIVPAGVVHIVMASDGYGYDYTALCDTSRTSWSHHCACCTFVLMAVRHGATPVLRHGVMIVQCCMYVLMAVQHCATPLLRHGVYIVHCCTAVGGPR